MRVAFVPFFSASAGRRPVGTFNRMGDERRGEGMEDFYDLLGVSEDASTAEIDRAWRERVRQYHPDVNDDTRASAQFKTLKTAHEVLADDDERAAYDRMGHAAYVRERLGGLPTADVPREGSTTSEETSEASTPEAGASESSASTARTSDSSAAARQRSAAASAGPSATTGNRPRRSRSPLWYGWTGVLLAGIVYLAGVGSYLRANAAALADLRTALASQPIGALTTTRSLIGPGTFAMTTASLGSPRSLLFPVGIVALAVAFGWVVLAFGRNSAYLYLLGGVAPAAALAAGPVVALPDGVVLALVAVVPLGSTAFFLVDAGRVLAGN